MKVFLVLMLIGSTTWAMDSSRCSGMLNKGWYKKYKWQGMGEANTKAITGETKSSNIISATTKITGEGTTAVFDPGYSTNVSVSNTQSTSSFGECSAFALKERKEQRDLYVAQNLEQIQIDVANGRGPHLETLSWFSLCEDRALAKFNDALQKNMRNLLVSEPQAFTHEIDRVIGGDRELADRCYVLSAN